MRTENEIRNELKKLHNRLWAVVDDDTPMIDTTEMLARIDQLTWVLSATTSAEPEAEPHTDPPVGASGVEQWDAIAVDAASSEDGMWTSIKSSLGRILGAQTTVELTEHPPVEPEPALTELIPVVRDLPADALAAGRPRRSASA